MPSFKAHQFVWIISLIISIVLGISIWDINFWPTDTKAYYFDAAVNLPNLDHLSQIHESLDEARVKWLHGKELFVLAASFFQQILNDTTTLRPFIVVCLLCVFFSSVLVFHISRRFWGESVGLACWFLFTASFWPYLYILFAKHQPMGLVFFLIAVWLLKYGNVPTWGRLFYFVSGLSMGICLFSSTVSTLYVPYYIAAFFYMEHNVSPILKDVMKYIQRCLGNGFLIVMGVIPLFIYVNYPDVIHNLLAFWEYVQISGNYNHFYYNQPVLQQWISGDIASVRGGWWWILKYFLLVMPILFPLFLFALAFLIRKCIESRGKNRTFLLQSVCVILISFSSPILAEIKGVAQYGGNYFTSLIGILLLVGYSGYVFMDGNRNKLFLKNNKRLGLMCLVFVGVLHLSVNMYIFLSDVYPTRMATTKISEKIKRLKISRISTYRQHPHRSVIIDQLNPEVKEAVDFVPIETIAQPQAGYILVPPVTKDSIYFAAHGDYAKFDHDLFLNELLLKGNLKDYAVASFKTLSSSRIWAHEEEILTYRYLVLNQFSKKNIEEGRAWILDAKKLNDDKMNHPVSTDAIQLMKDNVRNIGTASRMYIYKGKKGILKQPSKLEGLVTRIYKVGNPTDSLVAYIYKLDTEQPVWIPHSSNNSSVPIAAENFTMNSEGDLAVFQFSEILTQDAGPYFFMIYRTGPADDKNYYRIYTEYQKRIGS